MISSVGILITWIAFLNLLVILFISKRNLYESLVRINLFLHFLLFKKVISHIAEYPSPSNTSMLLFCFNRSAFIK